MAMSVLSPPRIYPRPTYSRETPKNQAFACPFISHHSMRSMLTTLPHQNHSTAAGPIRKVMLMICTSTLLPQDGHLTIAAATYIVVSLVCGPHFSGMEPQVGGRSTRSSPSARQTPNTGRNQLDRVSCRITEVKRPAVPRPLDLLLDCHTA